MPMTSDLSPRSKSEFKKNLREDFERSSKGDLKRLIPKRRLDKYGRLPRKLLRKGVRVDLGCGLGIYTKELLDSNMAIGIDFSSTSLKVAKEYCPQGFFILGDLEYLPLKDECVDAFFSFTSVYYLPPDAQAKLFKEIYRALKKNGNILLIEPNARSVFRDRTRFALDKNKVEKQLRAMGFKQIGIRFCSLVPMIAKKRNRRDPIFAFFSFLESIAERFQFSQLLGSLTIYAEK
jgi:ubiquinone/menaquinone biosynthesis C-methylase UbiE